MLQKEINPIQFYSFFYEDLLVRGTAAPEGSMTYTLLGSKSFKAEIRSSRLKLQERHASIEAEICAWMGFEPQGWD